VYELLRYGVKVKPGVGENAQTIWLIDWKKPQKNHFAIAEEADRRWGQHGRKHEAPGHRLYVNGIALGILELKRSIVSVARVIRQNLDNQKKVL